MSQETSAEVASGQSSPSLPREDIVKYVAPIGGGRKLYFYTFGEEKLELPEGAVLTETAEATHV